MKPSSQKIVKCRLNSQLLPNFGDAQLDQITQQYTLKWFDHYSLVAPGGTNEALKLLR